MLHTENWCHIPTQLHLLSNTLLLIIVCFGSLRVNIKELDDVYFFMGDPETYQVDKGFPCKEVAAVLGYTEGAEVLSLVLGLKEYR